MLPITRSGDFLTRLGLRKDATAAHDAAMRAFLSCVSAAALGLAAISHAAASQCQHHYARTLWDKPPIAARQGIRDYWDYELDHKIPLCLGGADSLENLQLQPWAEAVAKDEDDLCQAVCAGGSRARRQSGYWLRSG